MLCSNCPPPAATHALCHSNCFINCTGPAAQFVPFFSNPASKLIDILNACPVNPFYLHAPDLVVDWVQIGAVRWPQIWWNEVWRLDFQECTVS